MIYDIEYETMPREALEAIQLRRLKATIDRCYASVPFYRKKFEAEGITPGDIQSLKDLQRLPFTTKQDLRDNYPFGMFAVPMENVVRIHASSGTTGQPTVVGYTARDVDTWAGLMARSLMAGGATRGDIIHNAYGYGLFTGGLGAHYGAEALGATVIPISGGNTDRQLMVMQDFKVTAICCTPSYFLHLMDRAEELGIKIRERGYTLVPLEIYFRGGWAKVLLGLAKGTKQYDNREAIRRKENRRELRSGSMEGGSERR